MMSCVSARIDNSLGQPTLLVNDRQALPMLYALTDVPGGRWSWEEVPQHNIRTFAAHGIRLFQLDLFLEHMWFEDGSFDVGAARKQVRGVLDVCPDGAVMIRLHVNAPLWWARRHPEEWTRYADGEPDPLEEWGLPRIIQNDNARPARVSLASERWRQEATEKTKQFCREFAATPEGDALIGLQLACGIYGEWHYWGSINSKSEPDIGEAMTAHFRKWLKEKYGGNQELQKAWADTAVTLTTAVVPGLDERRTTQAGIFRDPLRERKVMDYYKCQHELVADLIVHFCRTARESWPRPLLKGAFYGYFFAMFGRQAAGGHLELERVLNSKDVDFLCAPRCYCPFAEKAGEAYRARGLLDTCRLHGKLWLEEMDQDPNVDRPLSGQPFGGDIVSSVGKVRRNVVSTFTRGMGMWFYDFGPAMRHCGWWDHPDLMAQVRWLKNTLTPFVTKPYTSDADVLVVYDTESFYHTASAGGDDPVSRAIVDEMTAALYWSGVAFHSIHRMDLRRVDLGVYKVIVLANTFLLSAEERAFLSCEAARDGRHVVSMYAPGYTDGKRLDAAFVSEAAGMELELVAEALTPEIVVEGADWPSCRLKLAHEGSIAPLFAVMDTAAEAFGRFAGSAHVGLARKEAGSATRWFCSLPITDAGLLRRLFKAGGAHVYTEDGDALYEGRGVLCLNTRNGGKRTIALKNGKTIELELAPFSTVLLDSGTGVVCDFGKDLPLCQMSTR